MSGFSIERNGFMQLQTLLTDMVTTLTTFGQSLTPPFTPFNIIKDAPGVVVLESGVDFLLGETQPWRIALDIDQGGLRVNVGTPLQITNTGYIAKASWNTNLKSGQLAPDTTDDTYLVSYKGWGIESLLDTSNTFSNWPLSYRITVTNRGLLVFVWGEALTIDSAPTISWFVVQRPVHPDTGVALTKGKAPLFCMYSQNGGGPAFDPSSEASGSTDTQYTSPVIHYNKYPMDGIRQLVIREIDINVPRRARSAVYHTDYSNAVINPTKQISFTEDREYLVTFPNGLATSRYAYIHEYDMIAYTSADVIPTWVVANISMYGESTPRQYVSMPANGVRESCMRLLVLINGGGVTYYTPPTTSWVGTR